MEQQFKKFGHFIKSKRIDAGLSQTDVSKALSYTPQFICNWEKGKSMPPLDKLALISKLYKIDTEELIENVLKMQETLLRTALKTTKKIKKAV